MLRRRLALYTLLYIAGIAAGFFIFERSRSLEAAGFCAAVIAAVLFSDRADTNEAVNTQKAILTIMFMAGFLLFAFRSQSYDAALSYLHDQNHIRGMVTSVSIKDDKVRLIIKNSEKGPAKILVTLDENAAERSVQQTGSADTGTFDRLGAYGYIGTTVEARGEFDELPSADDPGCFDYRLYMKSKGVTVRFKAYILEVCDTHVSEIDEEILEEFNNNSTGHILAVSGLHIGFLYGLLRFMTARRRTLPVSVLIIAVVLLYGEMTMWSPATVRACIVMTISLCSTHFRRCSDLLTSVSLAAFLILTYQPYQLFNSGFQLSFLALCGIAFLTPPISAVTGEAVGVMLAVQIGTMPVIAYSYCKINPLSILINVPVILLASVLVPVCILLLMTEAAFAVVPAAGIDLAELISYAIMKINHLLSFKGSFSIETAGPGAAAIILLYIFIFGLASEWTRVMLLRTQLKTILRQGVLMLMPLVMLFSCLYDTLSDDEIVFVAVGQGDCVHMRAEGHDVLIDGGGQAELKNDKETGYNVGKNILMPYLMHGGADAVDIALVTHLHADHYKGIEELSEIFSVGAIGVPADYKESYSSIFGNTAKSDTDEAFADVLFIYPYEQINIADDIYIEPIWPLKTSREQIAVDDPNEHNTVYMIHYKGIKIMVTGDLLEEDELKMVDCYRDTDTLECDILKVAHHGSKSSSSVEFLDAAKPKIAVIQCGRNNFYGHPHKQTLERLEERGIKVLRTDISGAVGIDIHGSRLSADLFK